MCRLIAAADVVLARDGVRPGLQTAAKALQEAQGKVGAKACRGRGAPPWRGDAPPPDGAKTDGPPLAVGRSEVIVGPSAPVDRADHRRFPGRGGDACPRLPVVRADGRASGLPRRRARGAGGNQRRHEATAWHPHRGGESHRAGQPLHRHHGRWSLWGDWRGARRDRRGAHGDRHATEPRGGRAVGRSGDRRPGSPRGVL